MRRMIFVLTVMLGVYAATAIAPNEASAQFRIGPHGGYNFDGEEGLIGADVWFGIFSLTETIQIHGNASFHWYFVDDPASLWGLDFNVPVLFKLGTDILRPYAGVGLGIFHSSVDTPVGSASNTNLAFNIFGGALFLAEGRFNPYAQFRYYISDNSGGEVIGGVMVKF